MIASSYRIFKGIALQGYSILSNTLQVKYLNLIERRTGYFSNIIDMSEFL